MIDRDKLLTALQELSDRICETLGIPLLDLEYNCRLKTTYGMAIYEDSVIQFNPFPIYQTRREFRETLYHEIAHFLCWERFRNSKPGYYKMVTALKYEKISGVKKCVGFRGIKVKTFTHHGVHFRLCLGEVRKIGKKIFIEFLDQRKEV